MNHLKENKYPALHWHFDSEKEKTVCNLCPRHCTLKSGQDGFCRVRGNIEGEMFTFNFGRSIEATIESIETEAVYHFSPGARILSLGNIGCMLSCSFCQNWQTSQIKHLNVSNVKHYTPEEVIDIAIKNDIEVISWTYNDPVVWQEFVVHTSKLAQKAGIKTLYKSALYIETEPIAELIEVIDIFSISLKTMDPEVYVKVMKGKLQPVLDGIKQIAESDRHLEISQLVVTGLNDDGIDATRTAKWVVDNLGSDIPLHFVGYHPAFRYSAPRTTLETLLTSRELAMKEGIKYCYLGNVYHDNVSNTTCQSCNQVLIQRFGLTVHNIGLDAHNHCTSCGEKSPIKGMVSDQHYGKAEISFETKHRSELEWNDEVNSVHILKGEESQEVVHVKITRLPNQDIEFFELNTGVERVITSKASANEDRIVIESSDSHPLHVLPVLDRAHFPVVAESVSSHKYIN